MLGIFLSTLATALSLLVVNIIFPGVDLQSFPVAMVAGLAIGAINGSIKPILSLLSLPITILSLGTFSLVVSGFCFWLASAIVPGFTVKGLIAFIFAPIILSFVNTLLNKYLIERYPQLSTDKTIK
ncbi:MAG: phage holin family protein [Xenococcaceae cyanobacterium]